MPVKSALYHARIVLFNTTQCRCSRALIYVTRKESPRDYLLPAKRMSKIELWRKRGALHKASHMAWHSLRILPHHTSQRNVINAVLMADVIHPFVILFSLTPARKKRKDIKEYLKGCTSGRHVICIHQPFTSFLGDSKSLVRYTSPRYKRADRVKKDDQKSRSCLSRL